MRRTVVVCDFCGATQRDAAGWEEYSTVSYHPTDLCPAHVYIRPLGEAVGLWVWGLRHLCCPDASWPSPGLLGILVEPMEP